MIEHVLGDLREEFALICMERGAGAARLWYARQLLLSMPMIVGPADGARALAIVIPMMMLDRLWCFVYSLIPMKDGLERAPGFLAANVVCACLCAVLSRSSTASAVAGTAVALAVAVSAEPPVYVAAALLSVAGAAHFSARLRRVR